MTHLIIFLLVGCSAFLAPVLKMIPMPVLYGVFLYMGLNSLDGLQLYDRVLLFFMPKKYQPDLPYLRQVPLVRVHLFTGIQLTCFIVLWLIQTFKTTSILFPIMLLLLIAIRKLLDLLFSQHDLRVLDDVLPQSKRKERMEAEDERRKSFDCGVVEETSLKQGKIKEAANNGAFVVHFDDEDGAIHISPRTENVKL